MSTLTRAVSWVLGGLVAFAAIYVAYAHFASLAVAGRYVDEPLVAELASDDALRSDWSARREGPLAYALSGGEMTIRGRTTPSARLELVSRVRALTEARITMQLKVQSAGAYDVMLGIESDRTGEGPSAIRYGLRHDAREPSYGWTGSALHVTPGALVRKLPGDDLDEKLRHPFDREGEWHEVVLHVSTTLHRIGAFVDGVPTGSVRSEWVDGIPVRVVFGVSAREGGQDVDVALRNVRFEPLPNEALALDWTDRFNGKVVDPRRWSVHSLHSVVTHASLLTTPEGLHASGAGTPRTSKGSPAFMLDTPAFPLSSVYARATIEVRALHHALFFLGLSSVIGGAHLRFFDVGVFETDAPPPDSRPWAGIVSGHWGRDAQVRTDPPTEWARSDVVTLEIELDAKTRLARAKLDGRVIGEHVSDLQPRELGRIRFGVVVDDVDSRFDVVVREVRIRALSD